MLMMPWQISLLAIPRSGKAPIDRSLLTLLHTLLLALLPTLVIALLLTLLFTLLLILLFTLLLPLLRAVVSHTMVESRTVVSTRVLCAQYQYVVVPRTTVLCLEQ